MTSFIPSPDWYLNDFLASQTTAVAKKAVALFPLQIELLRGNGHSPTLLATYLPQGIAETGLNKPGSRCSYPYYAHQTLQERYTAVFSCSE